jgi:hypothetical protein
MSSSSIDKKGVEIGDKPVTADAEGQVGVTYLTSTNGAVMENGAHHAPEYESFIRLKTHFESDSKVYRKLLLRLDLRMLPFLFIYYLLNLLDKSNAGNVKICTFLADTNMASTQFNLALT